MISTFFNKNFYLLLIVPYVVGLIGILLPVSRSLFLSLTPINLIFSFILVMVEESKWLRYNILGLIFILLASFGLEYLGVTYGFVFGNYSYGKMLGYTYLGVPVIIAFNWAMLCVASRSLVNLVTQNAVLSSFLAATVVTAYDYLLEPVAIRFGWWAWDNGSVPLFNYGCWFVFALIFQLTFRKVPSVARRSYWMIFIQAAFFWILLLM
jgi:bisanhydrobacterioruberin hydratase